MIYSTTSIVLYAPDRENAHLRPCVRCQEKKQNKHYGGIKCNIKNKRSRNIEMRYQRNLTRISFALTTFRLENSLSFDRTIYCGGP